MFTAYFFKAKKKHLSNPGFWVGMTKRCWLFAPKVFSKFLSGRPTDKPTGLCVTSPYVKNFKNIMRKRSSLSKTLWQHISFKTSVTKIKNVHATFPKPKHSNQHLVLLLSDIIKGKVRQTLFNNFQNAKSNTFITSLKNYVQWFEHTNGCMAQKIQQLCA